MMKKIWAAVCAAVMLMTGAALAETDVRVMALKALGGTDGGGSTAAVIKAIRYAEDNGAVICNLSLTSTVDDKALYEAMKNSSMLFVVATGNGNPKTVLSGGL